MNSCGNMPVVVQNVSELLWRKKDKTLTCGFPSITVLKFITKKKKKKLQSHFYLGYFKQTPVRQWGSSLEVLILQRSGSVPEQYHARTHEWRGSQKS